MAAPSGNFAGKQWEHLTEDEVLARDDFEDF
jgi:hypothetical protein